MAGTFDAPMRDFIGERRPVPVLPFAPQAAFTVGSAAAADCIDEIGGQYGLPVMYGSVICGGLFVLITGSRFSRMLRFFPPVVIGSIVTVIGLSLLPVAGDWFGAGGTASPDFDSYGNLGLGLATIALIVAIGALETAWWPISACCWA